MNMQKWLQTIVYRLRQVRQQLGFVAPLSADDHAEVARWLPASAIGLFQEMSVADQQHSLRVCRGLQGRGCKERDLLAAALLGEGVRPIQTLGIVLVLSAIVIVQLPGRGANEAVVVDPIE